MKLATFLMMISAPTIIVVLSLSYLEILNLKRVNCFYYQQEKSIPTVDKPKGHSTDNYRKQKLKLN